ncbi:hypothetical protein A2833_03040 [Candidatus Azambacteria bacterium RIFCSPHIGHO2_01_FULL_44_55]|uniref:VWFA domain-containing protein n=1 Tax=Candidatus Azambacteria bacterium RIFCSPLOWO2_02_FULL_44_14 TaxID=1797306 RepID=A0A1F5CBC7_9BACT|nr:MAG: hypothetical protein A3A18_02355 [Candidatus Azambacteria bacterium RIFCSPLOWO2_01_FULL_44_84]OGD33068.1 MAG: hypothetical protein A3C78_01680 [Candidatus Azambacteria bacterium RIFCSPHIGHO2_02_FULL_45_18]OGD40159.1 MAG: hypothetical protein A3I30_02735 [Candidatus Azambacteria bacterium RIFCSPLOWO2_02_FULL_44_14]OGD41691.1 MAG: hypothetical protein A2833_03040 [Candidatus Azambacteria bacterium RIFCSPHIGHO2_01_FULL_44_55]
MWSSASEWIIWIRQIQFGRTDLQKWVLVFLVSALLFHIAVEIRRYLWRRKNFGQSRLIKSISHWPRWWQEVLRSLAFVSGLVLAGLIVLEPINKTVDHKPVREPALIAVGLDGSMSMLAKVDPSSSKSRLDLSKEQIEKLVTALKKEGSSDKLILFTFAEEPHKELKDFTDDYPRIFLPALDSVEDFYVRAFGYGTDLSKVMEFCAKAFPKSEYQKICLVVTDGELEGKDLKKLDEDFQKSLKEWRVVGKGIKLYFIAVGHGGRAERIPKFNIYGNATNEYETDDDGKDIKTRTRPDYLRKAAVLAGGGFIHLQASNSDEAMLAGVVEKGKKIIGWKKVEKVADVSENFIKVYLIILLLILLFV